jgi:hypothetical protein
MDLTLFRYETLLKSPETRGWLSKDELLVCWGHGAVQRKDVSTL